jgi:hypothetical protein
MQIGLEVALFLMVAAGARALAADGRVAAWSFDEVQGRLAADGSGQGNQLLIRSGWLVPGVCGAGLRLDKGGSAFAPHAASLSPRRAISVEAWIQPGEFPASGFPTIVRKESCYSLRFSGGRLGFLLWIDGRRADLSSSVDRWQAKRWYHVAATYDGQAMRLFVDGQEDARSPRRQTGLIDTAPTSVVVAGGQGQTLLPGAVDEVRIYSRALRAEEVRQSAEGGRRGLAKAGRPIEPTLVGGSEMPVFRKPPHRPAMIRDGFLWIEAEDFADYGGWRLDTQFVYRMGSAYLIAADVGRPVGDATTEIDVPRAARWRVWVRAKNWLPQYSPGRFTVSIGGRRSDVVFGASPTKAWTWQSAGEFDLGAGRVRLALHDLTGYFGRCDALLLTTDLGYQPPEKDEELARQRAALSGVSLAPVAAGRFDVVVVGGGAAGCCAALAAARHGAQTALVQDRPVLGGNASIELGVPINGAGSGQRNARESGIIEEAGRIKARYGFHKMSEPFRILAEAEKNLKVFLNRRVIGAQMAAADRIAGVTAIDTLRGTMSTWQGTLFIDCTGDGWLGYYAGARFRLGRESRDEFHEDLAPPTADTITMSGCLMGDLALSYRAENTGRPVRYDAPAWAAKLPGAQEFGRHIRGFAGGEWWLEHEGTIDNVWDPELARDELVRISFGYWDYIKNRWPERERAANYALAFVPITNGRREARRLVGDYTLTQNDVQSARMFPDRISYGGWPLDVHHAKGIYSGREGPFHCDAAVPLYSMPYRILYSANIDNLLMAGRDVSVTHIALGTVRVQGTLSALGQAAGTAAALCIRHQLSPRTLGRDRIGELQQTLLKDDQYIPELKNQDPADLARSAKVTASSTADRGEFTRDQVNLDEEHPMSTSRAVLFPRGLGTRVESIAVHLVNRGAKAVELTAHLCEADKPEDFSASGDVATAKAVVGPGSAWVQFRFNAELKKPYAWLWLPKAENVFWSLSTRAPMGSCRAYGGGAGRPWTVVGNQFYAFFAQPALAYALDYRPENVVNGVARIVGTRSNLWASDQHAPLPQWLALDFGKPVRLSTVYVTFDTDMNAPFHTVPIVPECVRDYRLSYFDGSKWIDLVDVTQNFQRRRVHHFPAVVATRLRLTVLATNGASSARVFEIRAYAE